VPVLSLINLKGGVGKTSVTLHLAGALAQMGRRILAVDNDPQSSLTTGFLGPEPARRLDPAGTVAAIYVGDDPFPEAVIRPTPFAGIDLLPGSRFAVRYNIPEPHLASYEDQTRLRDFLAPLVSGYDFVLIDCPPNLHMCSWAAMSAATHLLVPVMPEDFGAQGTRDVIESAAMVRAVINPALSDASFIVSMFNPRRSVHKAYVQLLREQHGPAVFDAAVPEAVDYIEAVTALKPVAFYKPRGAAAKAVRVLAEELERRLAAPAARAGEAA
jgi:chromosome partitioning protein